MGDLFNELKPRNIVRGVYTSAAVCLLLAGCVAIPLPTVGGQKDSNDLVEFKVGSTTRAEAVRVLEEPLIDDGRFVFDQLYSNKGRLFIITVIGGGPLRVGEKHTRVLLEFDESNILKSMALEAWSRAGSVESATAPDRPATGPELSGNLLTHRSGSWFNSRSFFRSVSFSPTGDIVAASDSWNRIFLIDVEQRTIAPFDPIDFDPDGQVASVTFSPDGNSLAFLSRTIQIFDVETRTKTVIFDRHGNARDMKGRQTKGTTALVFVPNENLVVSGGSVGVIRVWQATTGKQVAAWRASEKPIHSIAISSDGELLATSGGDGFVRLWDRRSGNELGVVQRDGVVAFSPDGKFLAIAGIAHVELWRLVRDIPDSSSGKEVRLEGPQAMFILPFLPFKRFISPRVNALSFTPDSRMLVVSAGVAVIWDVAEGRRLWRFLPGSRKSNSYFRTGDSIFELAFNPDEQTMVTASGDGVRFWKLPPLADD